MVSLSQAVYQSEPAAAKKADESRLAFVEQAVSVCYCKSGCDSMLWRKPCLSLS